MSSITRLASVAGSALLVVLVLPRSAGAVEWCTPDTAKEAYNAILAAAPDGSELETEAKELADDRRADGEFDTAETVDDLDGLAAEYDYLFDCDARIYRYAPDEAQSDDADDSFDEDADDTDEDAAEDAEDAADDAEDEDESAAPTSPTTARPAPRPVPPTARPAPPRAPATPAPAPAARPAAPAAPSSSGSGSYAYSYNYAYPNRWAPTATPAPARTAPNGAPTEIASAPLVKQMPTPKAVEAAVVTETKPASHGTDRRLFLIPAAIGIALGVECMKRWAHRARRF